MTPASTSTGRYGSSPVVIVGGGLAGLVTALRLAPAPCMVVTSGRLGHGAASGWAQGGIAAAVGDDDSPALHAQDTLAAGAGLCDAEVVERVTAAAPGAVAWLTGLGARFDRSADGRYRLGLEGAHSRRRIVHARGDSTGAEVLSAVVRAVRAAPSVTVVEHAVARRVLTGADPSPASGPTPGPTSRACGTACRVVGVLAEVDGRHVHLPADRVVLATGGSGQLWRHTTNPRGSLGQGLALAARAGAVLRDLEMVQFHPTALDVGLDPMPLVSEAVRGAGALLVDRHGRALTDDPLAARDVVSRAVWDAVVRGEPVYLDARAALGESFAQTFPTVARACLAAGVDPATDLVPVRPAAHYQCGGVAVDQRGRTTVPGLWAVGEVAGTGLHGANRLASNSLLEAVVCAGWAAEDLVDDRDIGVAPGAHTQPCHGGRPDDRCDTTPLPGGGARPGTFAPPGRGRLPVATTQGVDVRALMSHAVGVLRDGRSLREAETALRDLAGEDPETVDDEVLVALLVTACARRRQESRGGHARLDHPRTRARARHTSITLVDALAGPGPGAAAGASCDTPPEAPAADPTATGPLPRLAAAGGHR